MKIRSLPHASGARLQPRTSANFDLVSPKMGDAHWVEVYHNRVIARDSQGHAVEEYPCQATTSELPKVLRQIDEDIRDYGGEGLLTVIIKTNLKLESFGA